MDGFIESQAEAARAGSPGLTGAAIFAILDLNATAAWPPRAAHALGIDRDDGKITADVIPTIKTTLGGGWPGMAAPSAIRSRTPWPRPAAGGPNSSGGWIATETAISAASSTAPGPSSTGRSRQG
ncbi:MAG: hypothetical protein WKF75_00800 [Singulisphaera sp.]